MPAVAADSMIATSHPVATRAGLRAFEQGGNAVDAALAAAAALTVAEPTENGVGGDAFALVWDAGTLYGINGSGRSPAELGDQRSTDVGPRSVTVPGAVRLWADLAERFGRFGLDAAVGPAADLAHRGLACSARIADKWAASPQAPLPAPSIGETYRLPELGRTLARIAANGPAAFYDGEVAAAVAAASWLSEGDLAAHRSEWVEPLRRSFRGVEVCELPPNGQGAAALLALALYEGLEPGAHFEVEAMKLALADTRASVHDGPLPADFFAEAGLPRAERSIRRDSVVDVDVDLPRGGTTYLCAVDGDGMAVSLIQSVYGSFGSGVVAGETGDRSAESRRGLQRAAGPSERAGSLEAAVSHDHPGHAAARRGAARAVRCHGRADAAPGPLPGRPEDRRGRRRPTGGARCAAVARRGSRCRGARAGTGRSGGRSSGARSRCADRRSATSVRRRPDHPPQRTDPGSQAPTGAATATQSACESPTGLRRTSPLP